MKAVLATVALLLAHGSVQAQTVFEKPKPALTPEQKKEQKAVKKATTKADSTKPERPAQERQTSEGAVKPGRARPPETQRPSSAPSPAQQMQQQQFEQRQPQNPQQSQPANASRVVQCNARPVCGGGYGRCAAVAQTYQGATLQAGRRAIVQSCIDANTPDSCNCASQCTAVARCSIF